jgi:hypothetical protein
MCNKYVFQPILPTKLQIPDLGNIEDMVNPIDAFIIHIVLAENIGAYLKIE